MSIENDRLTEHRGRVPAVNELDTSLLEKPSLLQRIGYAIGNPLKNRLISAEWWQKTMKLSSSQLIEESFRSPGGWRSMEIVYRNARPVDFLDKQALIDNPISMAARNRRMIVTSRLVQLIDRYSTASPLIMLGIGAGPGNHIQSAIVESQLPSDQVQAWLIDIADDAFKFGRDLATQLGISDCVHFIQGDARDISDALPNTHPHIVKLVGIVEYLTDEQLAEMLTSIHEVMVPEGTLLTHGLVDQYNTGPFLGRVFNLKHYARDEAKITAMLDEAGFDVFHSVTDPTGIHPIVSASRRSNAARVTRAA